MVDIPAPLPTVIPPQAITGVTIPAPTAQTAASNAASAAQVITTLPAGSLINAIVTATNPSGTATVQTAAGSFNVSSPTPFPANSTLVLQTLESINVPSANESTAANSANNPTSQYNINNNTANNINVNNAGLQLNSLYTDPNSYENSGLNALNPQSPTSTTNAAATIAANNAAQTASAQTPTVTPTAVAAAPPVAAFQAQVVSVNGVPANVFYAAQVQPPLSTPASQNQQGVNVLGDEQVVNPASATDATQSLNLDNYSASGAGIIRLVPNNAGQNVAANTGAAPIQSATILNISDEHPLINAVVLKPGVSPAPYLPETSATADSSASKGLLGTIIDALRGAPATPPATASPPSGGLKTADSLTLRVLNTSLPEPSNPLPAKLEATAPAFSGVVIGKEQSGATIVQSPLGTLSLPDEETLPKGTQLELQVISVNASSDAESTTTNLSADNFRLAASNLLSGTSSGLDDVISKLSSLGSREAAAAVSQKIPQPGPNFSSQLLNFISAVRKNDATEWLGTDSIKALATKVSGSEPPALSNAPSAVLSKLDQEFAGLHTLSTSQNSSGWNAMMFPVYDGEKFNYGQLYKREHPSANKDGGTDTRFIVDVDLDKLGPVQFDGLVQKAPQKMQFDLTIRTSKPLSQDMHKDITDLFTTASDITGNKGALRFQVARNFTVNPLEEMLGETGHSDTSA